MRRLALIAALAAWPAFAQTPAPALTPPPGQSPPLSGPSAAPPPATIMGAQPPAEDGFIKAIEDARQSYTSGINDMVRGIARPRRAETLCRVVPRGRIENWIGRMALLASSPGGRGVVGIEISPKVLIATNRTDAADERDKTLIDTRSPLFANAAALAVGDRVQFTGTLVLGTEDCFKEVGKDVKTSMTEPEFIFRLEAIKKVVPPPVNQVLTGQAPPMSIAQSSDFVRDAVDTIAGGVACGADQRRVFGIIIKLLIRATAGQSIEQRDALISLMFSPPSAQSQARENCEAKLGALGRLEEDAS